MSRGPLEPVERSALLLVLVSLLLCGLVALTVVQRCRLHTPPTAGSTLADPLAEHTPPAPGPWRPLRSQPAAERQPAPRSTAPTTPAPTAPPKQPPSSLPAAPARPPGLEGEDTGLLPPDHPRPVAGQEIS